MTRPRLKRFESHSRDRERDHKNFKTKTKVVETIKEETSRVKFTERDGSVNGTLWPKIRILKSVDYFFVFF